MMKATSFIALLFGTAWLVGCGATGQTIPLDLRPSENGQIATKTDTLSVGVAPFEDGRQDQTKLGVRKHFWGSESVFDIAGGKVGDRIAVVVSEFLRAKKGWNADVVGEAERAGQSGTLSAAPAVKTRMPAAPDVLLSGKVLDLSANAESKFMHTTITVTSKILVQGSNAADGSTIRLTLNGTGSQNVFWFEPEDVQALLREVINESLVKLSSDLKLDGKVLRLQ